MFIFSFQSYFCAEQLDVLIHSLIHYKPQWTKHLDILMLLGLSETKM